MESKRFEIKMSKKVWCAKNIENCLQIHHKGTVKVTEIKPPQEEKNILALIVAY